MISAWQTCISWVDTHAHCTSLWSSTLFLRLGLWFLESRELSTETDNGLATPQAMPGQYHVMQSSLNSAKSSSCRIRVAWWVGHFHWMLYDSRIEVSASILLVKLILVTTTIVCICLYSKWWTRRLYDAYKKQLERNLYIRSRVFPCPRSLLVCLIQHFVVDMVSHHRRRQPVTYEDILQRITKYQKELVIQTSLYMSSEDK